MHYWALVLKSSLYLHGLRANMTDSLHKTQGFVGFITNYYIRALEG